MQVLLSLEKFDQPASLNELIDDLGEGYPERTVRRWLADYARFGVVEKTGQKRATRYRLTAKGIYCGAVSHFEGQKVDTFDRYAPDAMALFNQPLSKRLKANYDTELLEHYHPNHNSYFSDVQLSQMEKVGARGRPGEPEGAFAKEIRNQLLPQLSYNSARLDDHRLSLSEVEQLLLNRDNTVDSLNAKNVSLFNYFETITYLLDNAESIEFDVTGVCTVHFLLSDALVTSSHAGKVRDRGILNNYTTYIPLEDPKRLQWLLGNVCAKAMHIDNPFEQSLFLMVHLTYLQPFIAANRRTARLCANIPLIRDNLVPLTFAGITTQAYDAAVIMLLERKDPQPLTELYYRSYLEICKQYDQAQIAQDFDAARIKYRGHIRALIYDIVANQINGEAILQKVIDVSREKIPPIDQGAFESIMMAEFQQLSPQRIAGTGLSRRQLNDWLALE